jgi:hypothetical protein
MDEQQFDERKVEPTTPARPSNTCRSIKELTSFCGPWRPLDNNICERALKKVILHRKNAFLQDPQRRSSWRHLHEPDLRPSSMIGPFDYLVAFNILTCRLTARRLDALNYQQRSRPKWAVCVIWALVARFRRCSLLQLQPSPRPPAPRLRARRRTRDAGAESRALRRCADARARAIVLDGERRWRCEAGVAA